MGRRYATGTGGLGCAVLAIVALLGACGSESDDGGGLAGTGAATTSSSTTTSAGATGGGGQATTSTSTSEGGGGSGGAATCLPDKFDLTQDNSDAFDFYELCVLTEELGTMEPLLQAIDATIHCDVQGAWAQCDGSYETGCHGDLEFVGDGPAITDGKWDELCEMSLFESVSTIAGGHFI